MKSRDVLDLLLLAAIWGGSFLFMRVAAPEVPPAVVAFMRVALASAALLPLLLWRGQWPALRAHAPHIAWIGVINSGLPFLAYAYAATAITAGLSSIFNASTPLWGALIAWMWLGDKPTRARALGLAIGFAGVLWLAWDKAGFKPSASGQTYGPVLAILACMGATLGYGIAASHTKRYLGGVPPLAMAAGSQASAALLLALPAALSWPAQLPSAKAMAAIGALGLVCTGAAYVLFFRLISRVGPAKAISVTFLVPVFAVLWGALFLAEGVTPVMLGACAAILAGTALVTGLVSGSSLRGPSQSR